MPTIVVTISNDDARESHCFLVSDSDDEPSLSAIIDINKFGSTSRLYRVTARVIKFINKLKKKVKKKKEENLDILDNKRLVAEDITAEDLTNAKLLWIYENQCHLQKEPKFDQLVKSLDVFTDEKGFLRCGGRIRNAPLPYDTINPYLLSRRHRLTELIIIDAHSEVGHNKVRDTLNNIRSTYWIPQGRSTVKRVIYECRICRKYEGKPYKYPNHLLHGRKLEVNVPITDDEEEFIPAGYETIENNLKYFWEQWKNEYITSLREQHSSNINNQKKSESNISVGDICVLVDNNTPRSKWKLVRVKELIKSKDGKIRGASIVTIVNEQRKKILKRPINKLVMIEQGTDSTLKELEPKITFVDDKNIPDLFGKLGQT